jgi:DNA helicase HerA-like ATPase
MNHMLRLGWIHGGDADGTPFEVHPQIMLDDCLVLGAIGSGKTTLVRRLIEEHLRTGCPVLALDTAGDLTAWLQQDLGLPLSLDLPQGREASQLRLTNADIDDFAQLFELPQIGELRKLVSALLGILQYTPRPGTPEHALIELVVHQQWESGKGVPLPHLAELVAHPPFKTLGAFELDFAIPPERRAELASCITSLMATSLAWGDQPGRAPSLTDMLTSADKPAATVLSFGQHSLRTRRFIGEVVLAMIEYANPDMLLVLDEAGAFLPPGSSTPTSRLLLEFLREGIDFTHVGLALVAEEPADLPDEVVDLCQTWIVGRMPTATSRRSITEALDSVRPPIDPPALDRKLASLEFGQHLLRSIRLDSVVAFRTSERPKG